MLVLQGDWPVRWDGGKVGHVVHSRMCRDDDVFVCVHTGVTIGIMTIDTKDELRKQFFTQRKELGLPERQRQSDALCDILFDWYRTLDAAQRSANKVAMTIKFGTEPDTDPLMRALHDDGVELWVPISNADRSMAWTRWYPGVPMQKSALGPIDEPVGERFSPDAVADADVILVPALAADTAGYRMGKGGGYYDRFLAELPKLTDDVPLLVTPLFDHEYFGANAAAFPVEDHDLPVQAVVTADTGIVWV